MVVHSDELMRIPNLAVVCPITKAERGVPNHVAIPPASGSGLSHPSYVMTEQIKAVDRRFVGERLGAAPRSVTNAVLLVIRDRMIARPLA